MRRLALEVDSQHIIRRESLAAGASLYGPRTLSLVAECLRQLPYSTAIGPPRKLLADLELSQAEIEIAKAEIAGGALRGGVTLPNGSLLFVMHPGLAREGWNDGNPPPLRRESDTVDVAREAGTERLWGGGARACPAADPSLAFLASALAVLLRNFRITPPVGLGRLRAGVLFEACRDSVESMRRFCDCAGGRARQ